MDIFPDFGAVGGAADLREIVGALLMFVLITCRTHADHLRRHMGVGREHGNYQTATRARIGRLARVRNGRTCRRGGRPG